MLISSRREVSWDVYKRLHVNECLDRRMSLGGVDPEPKVAACAAIEFCRQRLTVRLFAER
jgi:hypothetical protein